MDTLQNSILLGKDARYLAKDTCVAKLNSDFELIKGLNECDDAYRVIPQPTARPCEVDIQKQYKEQKKLSLDFVIGKEPIYIEESLRP